MNIGLVVGHNSTSRGAVRVTDGVPEWVWNTRLAEQMQSLSPNEIRIFYRTAGLGYTAEIKKVYAETDAWGADVTAELHFNSIGLPEVTGTETYYHSKAGKVFADLAQAAMLDALGLRDRRTIQRTEGRGALSLSSGKAPAVLLEPYFGSNANDCEIADANFNKLAGSLVTALKGTPVLTVPVDADTLWESKVMKWLSEFPKRA